MDLSTLALVALLLAAVLVADRGAEAAARPFQKLRRSLGLSGAAGGALVAVVTAGPEVGINAAAAARGSSEVGLGNMLGANIVSIPLILGIAWGATRWFHRQAPERNPRRLHLDRETLGVQGLPYLAILALIGLVTLGPTLPGLPEGWAGPGLHPLDGLLMVFAFVAFYAQALFRHRTHRRAVRWRLGEVARGLGGAIAIAVGAWFAVQATEGLVDALAIPPVYGGLFISSTMSVVPEALKTWVLVRVGETTAGTTSVVADNVVTMTLGFLPLALVEAEIADPTLFVVNLVAAATFGIAFCLGAGWARRGAGVPGGLVAAIAALYLVWAGVVLALAAWSVVPTRSVL